MNTPTASNRDASALVIILAFLILLTVLTIGLMDTVRTETVSANSHLDGTQAEFYAQIGIDRVVAALQAHTAPQQNGSNNVYFWISQPGLLTIGNGANGQLSGTVALYSGSADAALADASVPSYFRPPDLNIPVFGSSEKYTVTQRADAAGRLKMPLKWIYVRHDGSTELSGTPGLTDTANPIVGRYAYWADDESGKINDNLAWGRSGSNQNLISSPTKVDLTALSSTAGYPSDPSFTSSMANTLQAFVSKDYTYASLNNGFFNSSGEARRVNGEISNALENYKVELTHYNSDPDLSCFNEPRIVLTTQKNRANGKPYLNILSIDNSNPGDLTKLDLSTNGCLAVVLYGSGGSLSAPVSPGLCYYLNRQDWPMAPGSSFRNRYCGSGTNMVLQMALNIIEYVRAKESPNSLIAPIRITPVNGGMEYMGINRAPCITELGVCIPSGASTTGTYAAKMKMEVYLPEAYGVSSVDLTSLWLSIQVNRGAAVQFHLATADCSPKSTLEAGKYVTITKAVNVIPTATYPLTKGTDSNGQYVTGTVNLRVAIALTQLSDRLDLVNSVNVPVDSRTAEASITSCEVDDPRVNRSTANWNVCKNSSPPHTFGSQNSWWSADAPPLTSISPQQDTDSSGKLSVASFFMPPPAGKTYTRPNGITIDDNTAGVVSSVGELGYVHTGVDCSSTAGIPWRSFRFQPNSQAASEVPDWALMDIFTVPAVYPSGTNAILISGSAQALFAPNGNSVGGRVNVNATSVPFSINRTLPLTAVFQGCRNSSSGTHTLTTDEALNISKNIQSGTIALNGKNYGFQNGFYTPGEMVEIKGVADNGEESEELIRQVAGLTTSRGNVFTIYGIGQSLKQALPGKLVVTGEKRLQTMVERYVYDSATGAVRIRMIYYKDLNP